MADASKRVVVGMSGGVDSSVAALRLVEQGYEVIGVTLRMWFAPNDLPKETPSELPSDGLTELGKWLREPAEASFCRDAVEAEKVAKKLGIRHFVVDRREAFFRHVVAPFLDQYARGCTPCPCAVCNPFVKFPGLVTVAQSVGASMVATGHYARVVYRAEGPRVGRGVDSGKDQSYFLACLSTQVLGRLLLPLGQLTKHEVREQARARGLATASRSESQDLCFVSDGGYAKFIEKFAPDQIRRGWLMHPDGRKIALHDGIHNFTLGQRKGLGIAVGKRVFVTCIDPRSGDVVVGDEGDSFVTRIRVASPTIAVGITLPIRAVVQVRYRDRGAPAQLLQCDDGSLEVVFDSAVRAASPGQYAVAYVRDEVVAAGMICREES